MSDKPPLIASQRMLLLDPGVNPLGFLLPEPYRAGQLRVRNAGGRDGADRDGRYWYPVSFRELFLDSGIQRLGLTAEAGIGKSTVLQRAQHEIMRANPRVLAIYVRLRDLPEAAADYLHLLGMPDHPPYAESGYLVRIMCQDLGRFRTSCPQAEQAILRLRWDGDALLYRLTQAGRLLLVVDALDEISRADGDSPVQVPRGPRRDRPVVNVSWYDAWAFCLWLGDRFGLPTEKQWEYGCRAGTQTMYCFGNLRGLDQREGGQLDEYAWILWDEQDRYRQRNYQVGRKKPNAWGLYDMQGNVMEWCADWYVARCYQDSASERACRGPYRVLRGNSWEGGPWLSRSATRGASIPESRSNTAGFRVARTP